MSELQANLFSSRLESPVVSKANGCRKRSPKQEIVLEWLESHETINIDAAVSLIGGNVYCNERFYVGLVLSNMVKRGMLARIKPGVFKLP